MNDAYFDDLEHWRASKDGRAAAYIHTLGSPRVDPVKFDIELNSRLTKAFTAGWNAHASRVDAVISDTVGSIAPPIKTPSA